MARIEVEKVADVRCAVGEGVFWDEATQSVWFVDITPGHLYRLKDGTLDRWEFGEPLGCLALDVHGRPVLALKSGIVRVDLATGARTPVANPEADRPHNRFNDGTVDRQGRFWAGSMKMGGDPERTGAFYRLDADGRATRVMDGYFTTNGLAFSPDGRTMYLSDSNADVRMVWAADYDPATGTPGPLRPFFDTRIVHGRPDGAVCDDDGCYWMAGIGGWQLVRITPAGVIDRIVEVPVERPSRPAFGGKDRDVLYVTSLSVGLTPGTEDRQPFTGSLIAVHGTGVKGPAQPRFAG